MIENDFMFLVPAYELGGGGVAALAPERMSSRPLNVTPLERFLNLHAEYKDLARIHEGFISPRPPYLILIPIRYSVLVASVPVLHTISLA